MTVVDQMGIDQVVRVAKQWIKSHFDDSRLGCNKEQERLFIVCSSGVLYKNLNWGGGQFDPPPYEISTVSIARDIMTFFFQVLRIFWYQVCDRTIGREVTRLFVLARRLKMPKIRILHMFMYHMEITDFLKMLILSFWVAWKTVK